MAKASVRSFYVLKELSAKWEAWCNEHHLKFSVALNALFQAFFADADLQRRVYAATPEAIERERQQQMDLRRGLELMWNDPGKREEAERRYRELGWKTPAESQRDGDETFRALWEANQRRLGNAGSSSKAPS